MVYEKIILGWMRFIPSQIYYQSSHTRLYNIYTILYSLSNYRIYSRYA